MAEELKALIDKINREAVQEAETKAKAIEKEALHKSQRIIEDAKNNAKNILEAAKQEIDRMDKSSKASIQQASRDTVLSLKKEITAILDKVIVSGISKALSPEELIKVIVSLLKDCKTSKECEVVISLKKEDLEKIEKGLFAQLGEELRKGIALKASGDIKAGFIISYDKAKSHFDFTDEAIAKYLGIYLRPKLQELLKG